MSRALQELFPDSTELGMRVREPSVLVVENPPNMPQGGTAPVYLPGGVKAIWRSLEDIIMQKLGEFAAQLDMFATLEAEVVACQPLFKNIDDLLKDFRR
jgi:hypothetical protein